MLREGASRHGHRHLRRRRNGPRPRPPPSARDRLTGHSRTRRASSRRAPRGASGAVDTTAATTNRPCVGRRRSMPGRGHIGSVHRRSPMPRRRRRLTRSMPAPPAPRSSWSWPVRRPADADQAHTTPHRTSAPPARRARCCRPARQQIQRPRQVARTPPATAVAGATALLADHTEGQPGRSSERGSACWSGLSRSTSPGQGTSHCGERAPEWCEGTVLPRRVRSPRVGAGRATHGPMARRVGRT
jgi:hypothetical protein